MFTILIFNGREKSRVNHADKEGVERQKVGREGIHYSICRVYLWLLYLGKDLTLTLCSWSICLFFRSSQHVVVETDLVPKEKLRLAMS